MARPRADGEPSRPTQKQKLTDPYVRGLKAVDLADYLAAINSQRRVLATIGLQRRLRDITPTLEQIAKHMADEDEAE